MWNINFKTFIKDEIQEEGFDTSFENNLDKVLTELDDKFDLIGIDKVELTINKLTD